MCFVRRQRSASLYCPDCRPRADLARVFYLESPGGHRLISRIEARGRWTFEDGIASFRVTLGQDYRQRFFRPPYGNPVPWWPFITQSTEIRTECQRGHRLRIASESLRSMVEGAGRDAIGFRRIA